ncbi:MAG: hypothetical protein EHM43_07915, partial [Ignavibacteriae bacterium]
MDARTKLRLLLGPVRPFIMGKLRDAVMRPLKRRRALAMLRTSLTDAPPLRRGVLPLPPPEWIANHGATETQTAVDMAAGRFHGFGIDTWDRDRFRVSAPDPR